jgi:hypothetical protein
VSGLIKAEESASEITLESQMHYFAKDVKKHFLLGDVFGGVKKIKDGKLYSTSYVGAYQLFKVNKRYKEGEVDGITVHYKRDDKNNVVEFVLENVFYNGKIPFQPKNTFCVIPMGEMKKMIQEADSKEEAFKKVEDSIASGNPFRDFNAEWDGINTVASEVIETTRYCIGDEYNSTVEDVIEVSELETTITCTAFDLLRWEKDALYEMVEENLDGVEVLDMEIIPIGVSGDEMTYKCVPTEYKLKFQVRAFFFAVDEDPTTPYDEETYTIHAQTEAEALIAARDLAYGSEKASGVNVSVETEIE